MSSPANAKTPLLVSLGLVVAGLVIAAVGGITSGSIFGGILAFAGIIPAAWAAWAGMQQETQASLAGAIGMCFLSVGVGAILVLLKVVDWIR